MPAFDLSDKLQNQVKSYLTETFGIKKIPDNTIFYATTNAIYITTKQYHTIHGKLSLDKAWIPICDIARDGSRIPLHTLGNILWKEAQDNTISLSNSQIQAYAEKKDIPLSQNNQEWPNRFLIIQRESLGFSLAKKVDNFLKNKLS
jgi:NOL1/NOP2/fmu family ribosome biogenesis protein